MGGHDDRGRRHLVEVADLEARRSGPRCGRRCRRRASSPSSAARSISSTRPSRSPSSETGHAALEPDPHQLGLVGRPLGRRDELEDVVGRRRLQVLDRASLRGAPPEVVVDRVGRDLGAALDRDPVLAGVGDLLLAAHLPLAHRRDHLQLGVERRDRALDPDLVVALAGAAVGDRVAAVLAGGLDGELGDQRPAQRREQRVAAAVERVGLDRRQHVVARRTPRARRRPPSRRRRAPRPCRSRPPSPRRAGRG